MDMSPALEYLRDGNPFLNTAASPPTYHFQLPSWNSSAAEVIRGNNIHAQQLPVSIAPRGPVSINNGEHPYLLVLIQPSAFDQTRPPGCEETSPIMPHQGHLCLELGDIRNFSDSRLIKSRLKDEQEGQSKAHQQSPWAIKPRYARLKTWDPLPAPTMATISAPIERINPIEALVAAKTLSSILNLAAVCEELNDGRDEHD
ncbi:hypothetical protein KCU61_g1094, partial [Aureobasidium melanogenum]